VLGNGKTISVHHVSAGEVCPLIEKILREFDGKNILVRIGHGARLVRSRLINDLLDHGLNIEMWMRQAPHPVLEEEFMVRSYRILSQP